MENRLKIISIDEEKESLDGYRPEEAAKFHKESARRADKKFDQTLKEIKNQNKEIVLMCGGSASGKTEFIGKFCLFNNQVEIENIKGVIFDSTLAGKDGVTIKIKAIKKSGNIPIIWFILPDSLKRCFSAFNERDRKIPEIRFYETHSGAREVALFVAKEYEDIEIVIYQNKSKPYSTKDNLPFVKNNFGTRGEMVKFLQTIQLSKEEVKLSVIYNL